MKQLTNNELKSIYGGNPGWGKVLIENAQKITSALIALYNNARESVRDWGHTAGCKKYHPCK